MDFMDCSRFFCTELFFVVRTKRLNASWMHFPFFPCKGSLQSSRGGKGGRGGNKTINKEAPLYILITTFHKNKQTNKSSLWFRERGPPKKKNGEVKNKEAAKWLWAKKSLNNPLPPHLNLNVKGPFIHNPLHVFVHLYKSTSISCTLYTFSPNTRKRSKQNAQE